MTDYDFKAAQVYLIDKDSNVRSLVRGILNRMGMVAVTEFPGVQEAAAALSAAMPDLMVVDADPPEGEGLRFVQALRNSPGANNPFLSVLAMTWQPTQAMMVRFAASGADDLLVKPFSAKQVQERVLNLVEGRKPFVVTSDYVGPDRRRQPRDGQQIPLLEVPNTLRLKATGAFDREAIMGQIGRAQATVNAQKVVRHGFQLAFLVEAALPGLMQDPVDRAALDHLARVPGVLEDLMRRLPPDGQRAEAERFSVAVRAQVAQVRADPPVPPSDPAVLRRAVLGLAALLSRRTDLDALEQDVKAAVTAYRTRLEQLAQAKAGPAPSPDQTPQETAGG